MVKKMWTRLRQAVQCHLTRPRRIVLDLVLAVLLLAFAWTWYGYPLLRSEEDQFRQLERMNLMGEGKIVFSQEKLPGREEPARLTKSIFVDVVGDTAVCGYVDDRGDYDFWEQVRPRVMEDGTVPDVSYESHYVPEKWMEFYALPAQVSVLPLTWPIPHGEAEPFGWGFLALGLEREGELAELTLTLPDGGEKTLAGERLDSGAWYFWLPDEYIRHTSQSDLEPLSTTVWSQGMGEGWMHGQKWTLTLYNVLANPLAQFRGTVLDPM